MAKTKSVPQLTELVNQRIDENKGNIEVFNKIDKAVNCEFTPDDEIKKLPWVKNRHYGMTDVADARNAGARTFSTLLPAINIEPTSDDEREYEGVNMAEQALKWEFSKMNRGNKSPHEKIVESAITYHKVAFETRDLPFMYKGREKDPRVKAILRKSRFQWNVHHPGTVHAGMTDDVMDDVVKIGCYSAQTLINKFGRENEGVMKMLEGMKSTKPADLMKAKFTLVDYMDWTHRVQWAVPGENTGMISSTKNVFTNEEHGLPFIPWVVVDKGDPLWKSVLMSGTWDNLQYLNMIEFAKAIEQSTRSTIMIRTPDGTLKSVWIDFSNPTNPIVAPLDGTIIDNISPAPIDPQLAKQKAEMRNSSSRSTVSSVLQDIGQYADAPFSTVSQIVQMALGQLAPARNCAEDAEEEGFFQDFQWMEHTEKPITGHYLQDSDPQVENSEPRKKGRKIYVFAGSPPTEKEIEKMDDTGKKMLDDSIYVTTEDLYINVKLQADNQADEQSRLNLMINAVDKLDLSIQEAWERMGWGNYQINKNQKMQEVLDQTELQNAVYSRTKEAQDQMMQAAQQQIVQQQKQAAQQQKSQQTQTNEMNAGATMQNLEGQDMRSGSQPAAAVAPMEGPNQITGAAP